MENNGYRYNSFEIVFDTLVLFNNFKIIMRNERVSPPIISTYSINIPLCGAEIISLTRNTSDVFTLTVPNVINAYKEFKYDYFAGPDFF